MYVLFVLPLTKDIVENYCVFYGYEAKMNDLGQQWSEMHLRDKWMQYTSIIYFLIYGYLFSQELIWVPTLVKCAISVNDSSFFQQSSFLGGGAENLIVKSAKIVSKNKSLSCSKWLLANALCY